MNIFRHLKTSHQIFLVTIIIFLLHAALGALSIPFLYRDEAMYLINAAALSGHVNNFNNTFGIGYSMLIVPAFLCNLSPHSIFIFAIILNATMLAWLFMILMNIMRNYTPMSKSGGILAAALVSLYPSLWVYSNHAMPETLIVFLLAVAILSLKQALNMPTRSIWAWLFFAFSCAVLPVAHPRCLPILIVSIFIIFLSYRARLLKGRFAIILVTFQLGAIGLGVLLKQIANDNLLVSGLPLGDLYVQVGESIIALLIDNPQQWMLSFVGAASGQLFYMGAATYGLALIGIVKISRDILRRDSKLLYVDRLWKGFILFSFLFSLAVFAAQKVVCRYYDQFIFGRYIDPFAVLFIALAVAEFFSEKLDTHNQKKRFNIVWMAAIAIALFGVITLITRSDELAAIKDGRIRLWAIAGIAYLVKITGKIDLFLLIPVAFISSALVAIVYQVNRLWAAGIIALLFVISNVLLYNHIQNNYIAPRKKQNVIIRTIEANPEVIPQGSCIYYDKDSINAMYGWHHYNIGFYLFDREIKRVNLSANKEELCGKALITNRNDIDKIYSGACLAAQEENETLYLWLLGDATAGFCAKLKRKY